MRRGNGEGSVRQRPDGRWEARYYVPKGTGRQRCSIFGKTKAETSSRLREALAARGNGLQPAPARETVEALSDHMGVRCPLVSAAADSGLL